MVDKAEHAPIRNAYVLVSRNGETDKSARTDGNGRYLIELSSNIYDVFISAEGFAPTCRKIEVPKSGMTDFDAELDVSNVGMQESFSPDEVAPSTARGIVGDIPGACRLPERAQSADSCRANRDYPASPALRIYGLLKA